MKDAFIVHGTLYHAGGPVWTSDILKAVNYGVGYEGSIMIRVRDAYKREQLWAKDYNPRMVVHIGIVNVESGGFIVEQINPIIG